MARCERPLCTSCLALLWIGLIAGAVIMNVALNILIPAIKDLPDNVIKGFGEVFKFDYLAIDAAAVKLNAVGAIGLCNQDATFCALSQNQQGQTLATNNANADSSSQLAKIKAAFAHSLSTIKTVANDKYFGNEELNNTATNLNKITTEMDKITNPIGCQALVPTYCAIYDAGVLLEDGIAAVDAAIAEFEDSDAIQSFENYVDYMDYMHIFPWFMVLSLLIYTIFWHCGRGLCCCCRGGKCITTLLLIPSTTLCLFFFVLVVVFFAIGLAWSVYVYPEQEVPNMNGKPTVGEMIEHIKDTFPEFWNTVFADLETGLTDYWNACIVLLVFTKLTFFYEVFVCICRPYQKLEEERASA